MYEEPLDVNKAVFNAGEMNKVPSFTYIIETQELNLKLSIKDDSELTEGSDDSITKNSWRITISRHEEPDIETSGHYWEITELAKVGELK